MKKLECKIISDLMKACDSLMGEVCQTKATDWGLVNNALVEGRKYLVVDKSKH